MSPNAKEGSQRCSEFKPSSHGYLVQRVKAKLLRLEIVLEFRNGDMVYGDIWSSVIPSRGFRSYSTQIPGTWTFLKIWGDIIVLEG